VAISKDQSLSLRKTRFPSPDPKTGPVARNTCVFLSKWVICRFQPLIFQGILGVHISYRFREGILGEIKRGLEALK